MVREGADSFRFQVRLLPKGDSYNEYVGLQLVSYNQCQQGRLMEVQVSFTLQSKDDRETLFRHMRKPNVFVRSESRQTATER